MIRRQLVRGLIWVAAALVLVVLLNTIAFVAVLARDPLPGAGAPHAGPALRDLPLVEQTPRNVPASAPLVIYYTGDNGWQDGDLAFTQDLRPVSGSAGGGQSSTLLRLFQCVRTRLAMVAGSDLVRVISALFDRFEVRRRIAIQSGRLFLRLCQCSHAEVSGCAARLPKCPQSCIGAGRHDRPGVELRAELVDPALVSDDTTSSTTPPPTPIAANSRRRAVLRRSAFGVRTIIAPPARTCRRRWRVLCACRAVTASWVSVRKWRGLSRWLRAWRPSLRTSRSPLALPHRPGRARVASPPRRPSGRA